MQKYFLVLMKTLLFLFLTVGWQHPEAAQTDQKWKPHDRNRPAPAAVDPGEPGTQTSAGRAPADAIVLFDGKDLSKWTQKDGSAAKWKVARRILRGRPQNQRHHHQAAVWGYATARRVSRARAARRRRSGPRQQRRNHHGPLRNSGARFLPEQNLSRRTSRRRLRPISAAGQRLAPARLSGRPTTSYFTPRASTTAASYCAPRT